MKLSTTLLLCLTVNSVAAGGTYFKGTQGYCRQYEDNHIPVPGSKQECRQGSPCTQDNHKCTPNKFQKAGVGSYANCNDPDP
ncbi:Meiotic recombination protein [Venturia inaequalis]|nr:Meiotic recombination protein [Venturia inaequalis]